MEREVRGYTGERRALWPVYERLYRVMENAPLVPVDGPGRFVISSDLHLGNGGSRDDFLPNRDLYSTVLRDFYLEQGYALILNGDVEELLRFSLASVRRTYADLFDLFAGFAAGPGLFKIFGNHDLELALRQDPFPAPRLLEGLRLGFPDGTLLVLHGHQASLFEERCHSFIRLTLRYAATPLGIKNYTASRNSLKRYHVERRVYAFSSNEKVISVIGHTHRPLFASLSRVDTLKFRIEQLCREYPEAEPREQAGIAREIRRARGDLERIYRRRRVDPDTGSLYDRQLHIPGLFNAGCAIGRRGITVIEIRGGLIALVHWFDPRRGARTAARDGAPPEPLGDSGYYRMVIDEDRLEYLQTRIRLLT